MGICDFMHQRVNVGGWVKFFFFFHRHYSPLWALACRTMSFHFFLSATNSLRLLTPSTWKSLSTSSFHLFLGLPLLLVSSSSWVKIFLGILSSILSRWPNQLILCPFIHPFYYIFSFGVSQLKTLNMFYLSIYWTRKVHNNFIFLCSIVLSPVSHSSNHQYHCWNLQDSRAVVWIFITLLRFSVDSPS